MHAGPGHIHRAQITGVGSRTARVDDRTVRSLSNLHANWQLPLRVTTAQAQFPPEGDMAGMRRKFPLLDLRGRRPMVLLVLACCGCSVWPGETAPPSMIGAAQYDTLSCDELRTESKRLLTAAMDHPTQISPQEQEQREKDLALINRYMDALNKAWTANRCAQ
jgi:hypothetical protein